MKVCVVDASGKLGRYIVRHALDRGYEVVGVCRARSVAKLSGLKDRITIIPVATRNREVVRMAISDCDGALAVLVPWATACPYGVGMSEILRSPMATVRPNTSPERRVNGRTPGPSWWYAVHFHQPGPGVLPSPPA